MSPPPVQIDHAGVVLTGPAAFAALKALNSAIAHRRMSQRPVLPDIPEWLVLADALKQVVMSEVGHGECLKVIGTQQLIMTASEVATELKRSQRHITRLAESGRLVGFKTRNGWLFDRQAVTAYKEGQSNGPADARAS